MNSKWKKIWEKRTDQFDRINIYDLKELFLELKRLDGFDINCAGGGIEYSAWMKQHNDMLSCLTKHGEIKSIFEVGCGSGPNLLLFKKAGMQAGGLDYSEALIKVVKRIFQPGELCECICSEAADMPVNIKYDAVLSNGVFHYFADLDYAKTVLEKMIEKANRSIGLLDIHDIDKKDQFLFYRRKEIENYDEIYGGLDKMFYSKNWFKQIAEKYDCDISFAESDVKGYWNNDFVYHVFLYKK